MADFQQLTKARTRGDTDRAMNTTAIVQRAVQDPKITMDADSWHILCGIVENTAFTPPPPAFGAV
jgi:hypothetical protein